MPTDFVKVNKWLRLRDDQGRGIAAAMSGTCSQSAQLMLSPVTLRRARRPDCSWVQALEPIAVFASWPEKQDGFFFARASYIARETQISTKTGMESCPTATANSRRFRKVRN
jgi:hypothetical protein